VCDLETSRMRNTWPRWATAPRGGRGGGREEIEIMKYPIVLFVLGIM